MHSFRNHRLTTLALAITLGLCSYNSITQAATTVGNGTASGTNSIAIGTTTTTGATEALASGGYTIAIGSVATASADNAIAIGTSSTASTASSIAIGNTATANATNTISIGSGSKASVDGNVAFGVNADANSQHGTAIGTNSVAGSGTTDFTGDNANINAVAIGYGALSKAKETTAIGTNAQALANQDIVIGSQAYADQDWSTAIGNQSKAKGHATIAIGPHTVASGSRAITIGDSSNSYGANSIALGVGTLSNADNEVTIGTNAKNYATNTVLIGTTSGTPKGVTVTDSVGIGSSASVASSYSTAIGAGSSISQSIINATAIGASASATHSYSVSLGTNSTTFAVDTGTARTDGTNTEQNIKIGNTTYTYAGLATTNNGSVSVGNSTITRQVKKVAAGDITSTSTDAVNGSQLYSVATALETTITDGIVVAGNTSTSTGGDALSLGKTLNIVGAAKDTAKTYATTNLTTDETIDTTTGASTVTISMSTTPTFDSVIATNGTNTITISGATGTITGLTNTTYDNTVTYNSKQAATEEQLQSAYKALAATGIKAAGNTSTTTGGDTLALGKTLSVIGSAKDAAKTYSTANLTTDEVMGADGNSTITISMSTTPTFDSVTAGTFLTNGGHTVTISGATGTITGLTNTTYDKTVTYNSNRAATEEQLQSAANSIEATGIKAAGNTSTTTGGDTLALGKTLSVIGSAKDAAKTYSTANLTTDEVMGVDGNSTITVSMSTTPTFDSVTAGSFVTSGGNTITVSGATGTITGLTNTTYDKTVTYNSNRAATEEQLQSAVNSTTQSLTDTGLTFAGNSGTNTVKLGKTITVSGTGTTGTFSGNNIKTSENVDANGNSTIAIEMSTTPTFDSVTAGSFVTSGNHAVTISGSTGDITGLTNTTYSSTATYNKGRAATEEQLQSAINSVTSDGLTVAGNTGTETLALGKKLSVVGAAKDTTKAYSTANLTTEEVKDTDGNSTITIYMSTTPIFTSVTAGTFLTSGSHVITISGDSGTITGLTNTNWNSGSPTGYSADRAATEGELKNLQDEIGSMSIDYVKSNKAATTEANANASGTDSASLGYGSTASGNYSTAAGNTSTASGVNSTALGYGAKATADNSVALGAGSVTGTANTGASATKTQITDATGTSKDFTYAGTASTDNGTVSVGSKNHERQIQYVAAGDISATSTDAVNGSQLYATNQNVTNLTTRVTNDEKNISQNTTDITNIKTSIDGGITFTGNTGTNKNTLGSTFNIKGEGTKADSEYSGSNIKTVVDGDTLTIKMDENPSFTSITTGSGSTQVNINNSGISVGGNTYITKNGLNANNQTITNVANGSITAGSTDAVNGGQLYETNQNVQKLNDAYTQGLGSVNSKLNDLDDRVDKVGAGAAAIASLHPLDYDPNYKWDFAAGYGGYRSAQSVAIGAFYRPNENFMFSVGSTLGYDNNIYTIGVAYKFGAPAHSNTNTSRTFMARNTANLIEENKQLKAKVAKMGNELEALKAQVNMLAANIKK